MMSVGKTIWIINQYATTPSVGLGGRHYNLGRELVEAGYRVYVIAASYTHLMRNPPKVDSDFTFDEVEGVTYVWVRVPRYDDAHSKARILNWFIFSWKLRSILQSGLQKADFLISSSPSLISFLGARYLSRRMKSKLVFEVRDIWPLTLVEVGGYSKNNIFIRLLQWIEDTAYRDSDVVISNLENSKNHMISRGMDPSKFAWVSNGFSLKELGEMTPLPKEVSDLIPKGKFVVGYTGTVGKANALQVLIYAAEILRDQSDIVVVLVGSGREKLKLQELVVELNLSNVIFIDPIPKSQIQSMLGFFDLCYLGLTADPLFRFGVSPNKLFDYFYSAKPVLYAIDSGGSLVDAADAGLSIPPNDPLAAANAIKEIYALSAEKRHQLGLNGKNFVLDGFDYKILAEKLIRRLEMSRSVTGVDV